jgi:hypothetical protein
LVGACFEHREPCFLLLNRLIHPCLGSFPCH